jgi:membrane associated rhomboid family serine protease
VPKDVRQSVRPLALFAPVARKAKRGFLDAVEISAIVVLVLFAMYYVNVFFNGRLNYFGILPRTAWGLFGIVFSPLLHYNQAHLTANGISLFMLLVILFSHKEYRAQPAFTWIWILSGVGTWLIGRGNRVHIGASGVIYGVVTYLISAAWWLRSWRSAMLALLILFLYGGIFYGMLPQPGFISWEAHLSGAIAGVIVARMYLS